MRRKGHGFGGSWNSVLELGLWVEQELCPAYLTGEGGLNDPWGRAYLYSEPTGNAQPALSSLGKDGAEGGTGEDKDLSL